MKRGKKALVLFLALVMIVTSVPAIAAAEKVTNPHTAAYTDSEVENLYQWFGKLVSYLFDKKKDESSELSASVEDNDADEKGGVSEEVYADSKGQSTVAKEQNAGSEGQSTAAEEQNAGSEETNKGYDKKKKISSTKNHSSEKNVKQELELVENETTVENGELLRASTYNLNTVESATTTFAARDVAAAAEDGASTDVLKYFNTTLYDYDQTTINNATHKVEVNSGKTLTEWEGIYFNGGDPWAESYGYGNEQVTPEFDDNGKLLLEDGDYVLLNKRSNQKVGAIKTHNNNNKVFSGVTAWNEALIWTITKNTDGSYTLQDKESKYYMTFSGSAADLGENSTNLSLLAWPADPLAIVIKQPEENLWLSDLYGNSYDLFAGWHEVNDTGHPFYLYKVTDDDIEMTESLGYAEWNHWDKVVPEPSQPTNGQKMYTGLVENTLDVNKDIVFTKPDGGIFNNDVAVKDIYTHVEMPFLYNPENGYYTFDASVNGVYFKEDVNQESTSSPNITQDGTGTVKYPRLYFDKNNPQSNGGNYADGSTTVWMPFNNTNRIGSEAECNYHFGMRTTIQFSMTSNGRVKETDQEDEPSPPIKFSFSGDDDVWVFIDGHLVIDLGGIHNRLDAEIDFEKNTVTYSESNDLDYPIASFNDSEFELTQEVFGNLIPQDRTTFAATDNHELTIFYLERGAGSSNCKIEFNLPVKDSVTVRKDATKSWAPDRDEQGNVIEGSEGTVSLLTAEEKAIVDNIDFGFTLYRKTAEDDTFVTVNDTRYYLVNPNGQVIGTPKTDSNGHFTLKNGYSARFISTDMDDAEGVTYYVAEDFVSGFVEPDYNYDGKAANGFLVNSKQYREANQIPEKICEKNDRTSDQVTVTGGTESQDSLVFICSNFLDAEMPNPSARPNDDMIVIDYGLPVEIDILANDLYRGESMSIENIYCVKPSTGGMEPLAVEGEETPAVPYAYDSAVLAKNAKASSEQDPPAWTKDGYAKWAFDTEDHWWHTKYSNEGGNGATNSDEGLVSDSQTHWIQTGFDKVWYLDHITYVSRGENMNCFNEYKVYVANIEDPTAEPADEDFVLVKEGNLENLSTEQTIQLDEVVAATHVRIEVVSVHLGAGRAYVAAKQIKMYGYNTDPTAQEPETGIPEAIEGQYGTLEYQDNGKFRYTLKKQLTGVEVFSYVVKAEAYDDEGNVTGQEYGTANLYIIPATSMYYEENFSGFNIDNTGAAIGMKYATANSSVTWKDEGTPQTDCQEPGVVGTSGDSPYGSDKAYLNDSADSNGSSKYVDTTSGYAQFQYEFTGTGTAVMARVSKETGYIRVVVKQIMEDGTKEEVHRVFIDTMVLSPIEVTEDKEPKDIDTLYNIPVYDNYELDYGKYSVNVTVYSKGTRTELEGGSGKDFYLDGIKVYQPMELSEPQSPETLSEFDWMTRNVALAAYATDAESDCTIVQLRDKLIEEYTVITEEVVEGEDGEEVKEKIKWNNGGFVTFTDTHGEVKEAEDYVSIGPKNEIYLYDGQKITFSLADWDINTGRLYLGLKAPEGTGTVQIGGRNISVNNATDCYYDISNYGTLSYVDVEDEEGNAYTTTVITFSIKAAAESLISVTNVKVTGIPEFVIVNNVDIDTEGEEGGDIEVPDEGGDDIEVPDEGGDDIEVPDEEEYVGPYTEEHPFVFPTELDELTILEAEYAELHNDGNTGTQENGVEKWQLGVKSADWASNGQFVNSLNDGDRITIPFVAEQAGTYTVTVQFRSGSNTNKLRWFSTDDIIVSGEQSAGSSDSTQTRTVEFTMTVAKTGVGVLTFAPVGYDSPQFDKLDIVLKSVAE